MEFLQANFIWIVGIVFVIIGAVMFFTVKDAKRQGFIRNKKPWTK